MTTRLFTSWVRRGAAAGITEPDPISRPYAGPATFQPAVTLARDGAPQPAISGPDLPLLGPGAVVGIDARVVVRTDPAVGATSVEDNFLVLAELSRPDLPWLFTPAKPNADNRLRPWFVLVAVEASRVHLQAGKPLSRITVSDAELPDLADSWAWAHAQVTVDDPANAAKALEPAANGAAVARLLCPRRLKPDTSYLACIVPSTQAGAQAGLGLPIGGPEIAPAWTAGAGEDVTLPVYYSWTFATGDFGDFKALVTRLLGVPPDSIADFGSRTIDMSAPWESPPQLGDGMTIELDGALGIGVDRPGTLTDEARGAFETRLTRLLNFPADRLPATSSGDPTLSAVAPPIYAARHAGQIRVPDAVSWLRTLNLDPRRRIAAAFGAQYVQRHQEFLMARAWEQLGPIKEANRLRALAELAAEVADRMHTRHVQPLATSALFALAAPARTRVMVAATTLQATIQTTPMPAGAATVAFKRLSRPLGPLGRRAFGRATPTVIEQGLKGSVTVAPPAVRLDGLTTLVAAPAAAALPSNAAGRMIGLGWQTVALTEQAIPNPGDLSLLRKALDSKVQVGGGGGFGVTGNPVLVPPGVAGVPTAPLPLAQTLLAKLLPSASIVKRLAARVQVPPSLAVGNSTAPVMAGPQFIAPLALALLQEHPEYLLPGLGNFPDNRVTLLKANGAWIEAYLAGANHEMNRELLWREYPTDQRGTPFQFFWPRPDGNPDIPPITQWPLGTELGQNGGVSGLDIENMLVLLVRGEVLRRYPRTMVYAAPGKIDGENLALDSSVPWTPPLFPIRLDATTTAFAYALTEKKVHSDLPNKVAGWYFVFSEPVTGPRFNFDETSRGPLQQWTDLPWDSVPQTRGFAIAGAALDPPPGELAPGSPRWNRDAADIARIAFARPFRVGYHADQLLPKAKNG